MISLHRREYLVWMLMGARKRLWGQVSRFFVFFFHQTPTTPNSCMRVYGMSVPHIHSPKYEPSTIAVQLLKAVWMWMCKSTWCATPFIAYMQQQRRRRRWRVQLELFDSNFVFVFKYTHSHAYTQPQPPYGERMVCVMEIALLFLFSSRFEYRMHNRTWIHSTYGTQQ